MSMILKSYEEGKLALEDWTEEMLTTLPGWSGYQWCNYNCGKMWYIGKMSNWPSFCGGITMQPGDLELLWDPNGGCAFSMVITASDAEKLPLIAGKPYVKGYDGYYYIRGNTIKFNNSYAMHYDIARCTSIPGA